MRAVLFLALLFLKLPIFFSGSTSRKVYRSLLFWGIALCCLLPFALLCLRFPQILFSGTSFSLLKWRLLHSRSFLWLGICRWCCVNFPPLRLSLSTSLLSGTSFLLLWLRLSVLVSSRRSPRPCLLFNQMPVSLMFLSLWPRQSLFPTPFLALFWSSLCLTSLRVWRRICFCVLSMTSGFIFSDQIHSLLVRVVFLYLLDGLLIPFPRMQCPSF